MVRTLAPPPSKSKVDKAGALLREWWDARDQPPTEVTIDAVGVVWEWRAAFNYPLTKVNNNLRHYVRKEGCEVFIAQRLKRLARIIDKLSRFPRMRLTQMQDVGGCRAILPNQDAVYGVVRGIRKNWDIITIDDYFQTPKETGYRAVHAIVRKDGLPIEVQLRTFGQQDWADEVERIDGRIPESLKDGVGPAEVLDYVRQLAEVIYRSEAGEPQDYRQARALAELRRHVP